MIHRKTLASEEASYSNNHGNNCSDDHNNDTAARKNSDIQQDVNRAPVILYFLRTRRRSLANSVSNSMEIDEF